MKRIIWILFLVIALIFLISGCNIPKKSDTQQSSNSEVASKLLKDKGYSIVSSDGRVGEYVLKKELLLKLPYQQYWGVQNIEASDFINKSIETYKFIVRNHPLDNYKDNKNKQTRIWIMVCEGKAIGGYSLPDLDLIGWVYSLEGKTCEEVSGLNFRDWSKKWTEKYK